MKSLHEALAWSSRGRTKGDPHELTEHQLDGITKESRISSGPYLSPKQVNLLRSPVFMNETSEVVSGAGVPEVGKRTTPLMLEDWMHQLQTASGCPTSQYLAKHNLKWAPEHREIDILASFYQRGFPVDDIVTANVGADRKAFQDWYLARH
jgi:hypothetical protein